MFPKPAYCTGARTGNVDLAGLAFHRNWRLLFCLQKKRKGVNGYWVLLGYILGFEFFKTDRTGILQGQS
jgi:hypothetical protein